MKTKLFLSTILSFVFCLLSSQVPQGFNYQAIVRNTSGLVIQNQPVKILVSIQTVAGTVFWNEEQSLTTTQFGLASFIIGDGPNISGIITDFSKIDWKAQALYLRTQVQHPVPSTYTDMGTTQIWSVPYSLMAKNVEGPVGKLGVRPYETNNDTALFKVVNLNGDIVFAVYNEGVRVHVADEAKGSKGGFAVGGFGESKVVQNYLVVTSDCTRVFAKQTTKGAKGGFGVGGFGSKTVDNLLDLSKNNYFIGHQAGMLNKTGLYNSFFGYQAGMNNVSGERNVFLGYNAGLSNSSGNNNILIGNQSGLNNNGYSNVFIGNVAGFNSVNSAYNIFIGEISGYNNIDGTSNIYMGYETGSANKSGGDNVMIGAFCANSMTAGSGNVIMGMETANGRTSGDGNVFLGSWAGQDGVSGSNNVMVGSMAGYGVSGDNNVILGYGASSMGSFSNQLHINNSAGTSLIWGDFTDGSEKIALNGNTGIGTVAPTQKLDVVGNARFRSVGSGAWSYNLNIMSDGTLTTASSDMRMKENISEIDNALATVLKLRGVTFNWKTDPEKILQLGMIAQEVESVVPGIVFTNPVDGMKGINYSQSVSILIEAIKEQQAQIESQNQKIERLEKLVETLILKE